MSISQKHLFSHRKFSEIAFCSHHMKVRVAGARNKRREEQWRGEWVAKQLKDGLRLMYNILHTKHGYYRLHKIAMVRADILFLFFLVLACAIYEKLF